jgi:hypothetical protein
MVDSFKGYLDSDTGLDKGLKRKLTDIGFFEHLSFYLDIGLFGVWFLLDIGD